MAPEYHTYTPATSKQPAADGRPYGPGPRVPMLVISPWSRGGFVNSQICDHTSTLMFLEKRFGVIEPQISNYRRAVCGDLTSCFDFVNPNAAPVPDLPGRTTKVGVDALAIAQSAKSAIAVPGATPDSALPAQAAGTRPSRALPYELHTTMHPNAQAGAVTLEFVNASTGGVGALFHVYDSCLDLIPRRLLSEANKSLSGSWTLPSPTTAGTTSGCLDPMATTASSSAT